MRLLGLYVAAGVVYVGVGLYQPAILLNWLFALPFLVVIVWLLPALYDRLR